MVQFGDINSFLKLYFAHIFWAGVFVIYLYSWYYDFFKIKKQSEYLSDAELMDRFVFAVKKGIIKIKR